MAAHMMLLIRFILKNGSILGSAPAASLGASEISINETGHNKKRNKAASGASLIVFGI
jgi:hypothetical protein